MFTTGSKFFLGATGISLVAALLFGMSEGGSKGLLGTIALLSVAVGFAFIAGINWLTRDGNVSGVQQGGSAGSPATADPAGRSFWPMVMAVGGGALVVGAVTYPVVFKIGVIVLLAAGFEWLVQAWSERASNDPAYNARLRSRLMHPIEFPLLGAIGAGVLGYSFSRIMLWVNKDAGPVVFGVIGAAVLAVGTAIAVVPRVRKGIVAGVAGLAAVAIVGTGAAMAIDGQRSITAYPTTAEEHEICESPGEIEVVDEHTAHLAEIDERNSEGVSIRSNLAVTIELTDEGVHAFPIGWDQATETLQIPRSNPTAIRFVNHSDEPRRLTIHMGQFTEGEGEQAIITQPVMCTPLIDPDGEGYLTVEFDKSSAQSPDLPYAIEVPGVDGEIEVVVP